MGKCSGLRLRVVWHGLSNPVNPLEQIRVPELKMTLKGDYCTSCSVIAPVSNDLGFTPNIGVMASESD